MNRLGSRTLLVSTLFWVGALLIISLAAWITLFQLAEQGPRARQVAQLAASAVNITRAALIASAPENRRALLSELSTREGILILPAEHTDDVAPLPDDNFFKLVETDVRSLLGPHTRLSLVVNGLPGFWTTFRLEEQDTEEYWISLPRERTKSDLALRWLGFSLLVLLLALVVVWIIVSRLTRPLTTLADSAYVFARGIKPAPVPEIGADELKQLARAFNQMTADLDFLQNQRALILAGISHDLRTPLARLRLETEMSVADDQARNGMVEDIEQMDNIIGQFLDYARTDKGEEPEECAPRLLLENVLEEGRRRGAKIQLECPVLPLFYLQRKSLTRALINLIENARKYAPGPIRLCARIDGQQLVIEVIDHGPGISTTDLERIKRPFVRLEQARSNTQGTGLGLAIVERVARTHKGSLDLVPNPEGGLIARLTFPLSGIARKT